MSQWTNKRTIIRDLSKAQGSVPVALKGTLAAGQKPPTPDIVEDTEEEFFKDWIGGGDTVNGPDLGMIKHMLDMVRDLGVGSDEEVEVNDSLQISKLNRNRSEFEPHPTNPQNSKENCDSKNIDINGNMKNKVACSNNVRKIPKSVKFGRNVALTSLISILENQQSKIETGENKKPPNEPESLKLLTPEDFKLLKSKHMTEAVEKVNGWLNTQKESNLPKKEKQAMVFLEPSSMFKRKEPIKKEKIHEEAKKVILQPVQTCQMYVPSKRAQEYCEKLTEKSKMKQKLQESIWDRVSREMKEIDAQRKQDTESSRTSVSSFPTSNETDNQKLDVVRLPQHRHLLTGECIVCKVICDKLYSDSAQSVTSLNTSETEVSKIRCNGDGSTLVL